MRIVLVALSLFITGCSSLGMFFETNSFGMSIEAKKQNKEGWEYFILESYNATNVGYKTTNHDDLRLNKFFKQNVSDFIHYDIDSSITYCLEPTLLIRAKKNSDAMNAYKPLSKDYNYTIRISLVPDINYQYKKAINNYGVKQFHFYYPVKSCHLIPRHIFHSATMAIHEVGHGYFFSKNLYLNYSVAENEYWATKIAYCSLLNNPFIKEVKISQAKLTKDEVAMIKNKDIEPGSEEARLGYKMLHAELFSLAKTETIAEDNPNMDAIKSWCKVAPY